MMASSRLGRSRRLAVGILVLALSVAAGGIAIGAVVQPAIKTITPHSENDITNIDVLRQQIRNYYGDPLGTGVFAADSNYAKEAQSASPRAASATWPAAHRTTEDARRSSSTSTTPRSRPGTTRSSATGRTTRRPTAQFVTDQLLPGRAGHGRHGERRPRSRATRSSS